MDDDKIRNFKISSDRNKYSGCLLGITATSFFCVSAILKVIETTVGKDVGKATTASISLGSVFILSSVLFYVLSILDERKIERIATEEREDNGKAKVKAR